MVKISPLEDRALNKQLASLDGIRWTKTGKQWFLLIDESIVDLHKLEQLLPENVFNSIISPTPTSMKINFGNIFADICKKTKITPHTYTIDADVTSTYSIPGQNILIAFLIDDHKTNRQLRAKIPKHLINDEDLIDKRICITGTIELYTQSAVFQLNATNIKILGECSRLTQIEKWANETEHLFKSPQDQESLNFVFRKIGLISNENIQGYVDFIKNLKKRTIEPADIIFSSIPMTLENIIHSIDDLNAQEECDCICIVRGGGNPEELIIFSDPKLLYAIASSPVPVITGIGHKSDNLLCDLVADYNAGTPTGAAEYLNRLAGKLYYQDTKAQHIESSTYQKFLEQENSRLLEQNSKLLLELEKMRQHIAKKESRGIIGRIFNW